VISFVISNIVISFEKSHSTIKILLNEFNSFEKIFFIELIEKCENKVLNFCL